MGTVTKTGQEVNHATGGTFDRDGPLYKRGEDDQSRTPIPDDGRYVWWTTYGAGQRFGQICRAGKRAVWVTELSSMPRKTKHVRAPRIFCGEAEDQAGQKQQSGVHVRLTHGRGWRAESQKIVQVVKQGETR